MINSDNEREKQRDILCHFSATEVQDAAAQSVRARERGRGVSVRRVRRATSNHQVDEGRRPPDPQRLLPGEAPLDVLT